MTYFFNKGTTEYLAVEVAGNVELDEQTVAFSFDRVTWLPAAFIGDAGLIRSARLLLTPALTPAKGVHTLFVRISDVPEIPIINAGQIHVR